MLLPFLGSKLCVFLPLPIHTYYPPQAHPANTTPHQAPHTAKCLTATASGPASAEGTTQRQEFVIHHPSSTGSHIDRFTPQRPKIDWYIFGHPSGRKFDSFKQFVVHVDGLQQQQQVAPQLRPCPCKVCRKWPIAVGGQVVRLDPAPPAFVTRTEGRRLPVLLLFVSLAAVLAAVVISFQH